MQRLCVVVCRLAFLLFVSGSSAFATELAALTGYISDPTGLRVPQCRVQATNVETGVSYTGETNEIGLYRISAIPVGNYRVIVQKTGFKTIVKQGLELHVQDVLSLNFQLEIGSVAESVNVESGVPLINTESAAVSTVVDRHFVENLPLNGRSFQTLIALTPGVVLTQATGTESGQFSVNGQRADSNYVTVDGASANIGSSGGAAMGQFAGGSLPGLSAQGGTNSLVSVDAMQEFRIQTSTYAPEFGRTPGGQISIATRSGTNQFHGTLFEYFRNDLLDANDWFANHIGSRKPAERQNDFGGVFSGRILKDRTFFFLSYEGLRLRQPQTMLTNVPSIGARQSATAAIQPLLNAFPVPNGTDFGNGLARFNSSYSDPSTLDAYGIRVDHAISSKLNLFGRYSHSPSEITQRAPNGNLSDIAVVPVSIHTLTIGVTASFSRAIANELRVNYSNLKQSSLLRLDGFGRAVPPLGSIPLPSGFTPQNSLFGLQLGSAPGLPALTLGKTAITEQRQVNVVDNFSIAIGSHQLKFGVDYRWLAPFSSPLTYQQSVIFSGVGAAIAAVPTASSVFIQTQRGDAILTKNFSLYGQDTWRITSRLSATYGLRWDVNPALKGKNSENDPFTVIGLSSPATMTLASRGTPLYSTVYGNVAPRLGLAYQLRKMQGWETILKGGGGIFYDLGTGSLGNVTGGFPYSANNFLVNVRFPLTAQLAAPPLLSVNPPVSQISVADPHLKVPHTIEWSLALEQALGANQVFSLTYLGATGRDLLRQYLLLHPSAIFTGSVTVSTNAASSNYQALQLQFQRRVANGLQALASYTWSHSIDNASRDSGSFSAPGIGNPNADRGNSDFDGRHSFTAAVTYDLPAPRAGTLGALLGNWALDSFFIARSALPVDIVGRSGVVNASVLNARPNVVPGQPLYLFGSQFPGNKAFNKAAFAPPPVGQQGNFGRNVLRGFGANQLNFAVRRQFLLTERARLQFRAEFFNLFNHPNFGNPSNTNITLPQFGIADRTLAQSLGTGGSRGGLNPLYQIGGPRSTQLALRFQF